MLRSTFSPLLATLSQKPRIPAPSLSISNAFQSSTPPVCENASTNYLRTIQNPPASAYVHLPFCRKRCHYCDFPIVALGSSSPSNLDEQDPRIANYIRLLCREIQATKSSSPADSPLQTVFFGGGTPSLVPPTLVSLVMDTLRSKFGICSNAEISMEVDPGTFDEWKLMELKGLGVNRVSVGVQAFQDELLRGCGRAHGVKEVMEAVEIVGSCGFKSWSMDLISSLPHQTLEMWEESLGMAVRARPTHLSVYDLQVEQGTKFGLWYKPGEYPLPSENLSAMFYKKASEVLTKAGYNHYEISSYSKNGYECKHNLAYWQNKSFYGFGLGSASYIRGVRFSRPRKMKEYMGYVQRLEDGLVDDESHNPVDAKDLAMDVVMLSLRTARGLHVKDFERVFGSDLVLSMLKSFGPYVGSGHVFVLDENRRTLTPDEFALLVTGDFELENRVEFVRLSDPDGFLLSNELISIAFAAVSP